MEVLVKKILMAFESSRELTSVGTLTARAADFPPTSQTAEKV
jgi:hypothetical protein